MTIICKRMGDHAFPVPERSTIGSSGYDLYSVEPRLVLWPGERARLRTGWAFEIPRGYEGQIRPRSSSWSRGIDVLLGTIDSDYRGEVMIQLRVPYSLDRCVAIEQGERIAQLVISRIYTGDLMEVESLSETLRGEGGFGSTGISVKKEGEKE